MIVKEQVREVSTESLVTLPAEAESPPDAETPSTEPVIETRELKVWYGDFQALRQRWPAVTSF